MSRRPPQPSLPPCPGARETSPCLPTANGRCRGSTPFNTSPPSPGRGVDHPRLRGPATAQGVPFDATFQSTMLGTYDLIQAAVAAGVEQVIMPGNNCALGHGSRISQTPFPFQALPIDECHPAFPEDVYSSSKRAGALLLASSTRAYGIPGCGPRLGRSSAWQRCATASPYHARRAVLITSGGYEYNPRMRKAFLNGPGQEGWAFYGSPSNTGNGIRWIVQGATLAELAANIRAHPDNRATMDAATLTQQVETWNRSCMAKHAPDFDAEPDTMGTLYTLPYYAIPLYPSGPNPNRALHATTRRAGLDWDDTLIPPLYAAGEMCSVFQFVYQGGGNHAECIVFGCIAGQNTAAEVPLETA